MSSESTFRYLGSRIQFIPFTLSPGNVLGILVNCRKTNEKKERGTRE